MCSTQPMTAAILLLYLFLVSSVSVVNSVRNLDRIRCIERERLALLEFKKNLVDNYGHLSSWTSHHGQVTDCCQWNHVYCSNVTDHVIGLDLRVPCINFSYNNDQCKSMTGNISSSLLVLEHLVYLDLSGNDFRGKTIPGFISSLHKLRYLSLASSGFTGEVSYQLKNLSSLQYLDLSYNYYLSTKDPMAWLSSLSSLRNLTLAHTNLSQATGWANAIGSLPSLRNLDLSASSLLDEIPSSLIHTELSKSLAYIDLSDNNLSERAIYPWLFNFSSSLVEVRLSYNRIKGPLPEAFGAMVSASYLDLSSNQMQGPIPEAFGNLVSVSYLDISSNQLQGPLPDSIGNLSNLLHLRLSGNQLDGEVPNTFQCLCQLQTFDISSNSLMQDLPGLFKSLSGCPEKSLESLQLDSNSLTGSLPDFTMFSSLRELHLSSNKLNGTFPPTFQQISPLFELDLQSNQLTGSLPDLSVFQSLKDLYLQNNSLNGTVNEGIGKLSMLGSLELSGNSLKCRITESHLLNLSSLTNLDLSYNSVVLDIRANWTPPFKLFALTLTLCRLGPQFPRWLQNWGSISYLDISSTGISDSIPAWFWNVSVGASRLSLGNNSIHGTLPDSQVQFQNAPTIDLSHNFLEGPIPSVFRTAAGLGLSKNMLSGSFAPFLCEVGTGQDSAFIDLSYNFISGELPDCWKQGNGLNALALANNNFSGKIPASLGFLQNLQTLQLSNNIFHGKLPSSLRRCPMLLHVDVTNNFLSGEVPSWIGDSLLQLLILSLRNNQFTGIIPPQLCNISSLQILDLSSNTISGIIPHCLSNLSAMATPQFLMRISNFVVSTGYFDFASIVWKGSEHEYNNSLLLVTLIDLSSNKLEGEIPSDLSNLTGLVSLNLSRNQLEGPLSTKLGRLKSLQILDLSRNRISGEIPASFSDMSSLSTLNLSYNNLSGRIPSGTQLQSFNAESYARNNPGLCGTPLPHTCPGEDRPEKDPTGQEMDQNDGTHGEEEDSFVPTGLYVSVGLGFATGFWGICGTLIFSRTMRYAYFRFLAHMYDRLFLIIAKFQGQR